MNTTQTLKYTLATIPAGQIFGYPELPNYAESPMKVIKAVGRLVAQNTITRLSKGKFYIPKQGMFGSRTPADSELIRSTLYKNGRLRGYVTGLALYNQLGLTTQIPKTVEVAINGARQKIELNTITIKMVAARVPVIEECNVKLLQYLDALKDIKIIPDADINVSLKIMQRYLEQLASAEQLQLIIFAERYYPPQVRALTGLVLSTLGAAIPPTLRNTLNPSSRYKLWLNPLQWPQAKQWNID